MTSGRGMSEAKLARRVEAIRRFNRWYTRQIGLLEEAYLQSPFSLSEARVVYELAHHEETTASHLSGELDLDPGYLSRMLRDLDARGYLDRRPSKEDRRRQLLSLTREGQQAFATINAASRSQFEAMLAELADEEQQDLVDAMASIETILGAAPEHRVPYILRPHQPGDIGWVVHRHGVLYNREYGWDERFEALVAEIAAHFVNHYDPKWERCWIAEKGGQNVGSVFLVKHAEREGVAQLRMLLVEPKARGLGIGKRLVQECSRFARRVGYETIMLWTSSNLDAARAIYEDEGYLLVDEDPQPRFGHDLVFQSWELQL